MKAVSLPSSNNNRLAGFQPILSAACMSEPDFLSVLPPRPGPGYFHGKLFVPQIQAIVSYFFLDADSEKFICCALSAVQVCEEPITY